MFIGSVPCNWLLVWMHFHKIKQKKEKIITLFPFFLCWFVVLLLQLLLLLLLCAGGCWLIKQCSAGIIFCLYFIHSYSRNATSVKNYFRFKNGVGFLFLRLVFAIRKKNTYDKWKYFVFCVLQNTGAVRFDGISVFVKRKIEATVSGCGWPSSVSILVQCSLQLFFFLSRRKKKRFFCCWLFPKNGFWKFHFSHHWIWRSFSLAQGVQIQFGKNIFRFGLAQLFSVWSIISIGWWQLFGLFRLVLAPLFLL